MRPARREPKENFDGTGFGADALRLVQPGAVPGIAVPRMLIKNVLYRADATATAGRDTQVVSPDGALDLKVTMPPELGGTNGRGTNPEQLFAAAFAASFLGMLRLVSASEGISIPSNTQVEASVGVGAIARGFGIEVELRIQLPGMARVEVDLLVIRAHELCPYSNATRDNVSVRLVIV